MALQVTTGVYFWVDACLVFVFHMWRLAAQDTGLGESQASQLARELREEVAQSRVMIMRLVQPLQRAHATVVARAASPLRRCVGAPAVSEDAHLRKR